MFTFLLWGTGWFVTNILGQQIGSIFMGQDVHEETLSSRTSCSLGYQSQTNLHHATTQKTEDLKYTMAEAWNFMLTSIFYVWKLEIEDSGR